MTAFASAAICYFTENGLDPTQVSAQVEGVKTRAEVNEASFDIRKQGAEIGNRVVAIMRTFERELFKVLEAQQTGTVGFLARIEENLLNHQVAVETQVLAPLLERTIKSGVEGNINRLLLEILLLKQDETFTPEKLRASTADYNEQRDRRVVEESRKLLEAAHVTQPTLSTQPLIARPTPPPPKPTIASTAPKT